MFKIAKDLNIPEIDYGEDKSSYLEEQKFESVVTTIESLRQQKRYNSKHVMLTKMRNELYHNKVDKAIIEKNQVTIKLTITELTHLIEKYCDLSVYRTTKAEPALYIHDPLSNLMVAANHYIYSILSSLSSPVVMTNDGQRKDVTVIFIIDDIKSTSYKIIDKLRYNMYIRDFVKLPNYYVVTSNDLVINLKTKEVYSLSDIELSYDITSKCAFNFTTTRNDKSILNRQIINRVMKDWTNNNAELEYLLWQMIYAVIQNDNHDKCFMLSGPGGNGKSTFLEILSIISGYDNVVYANMHQFDDPNAINSIDMNTRLVAGDDLATKHRMSSVAMSHLKTLVTTNPLSVSVKYEPNKTIRTNALIVQCTNTDVAFSENNPAIKSRMIHIKWTDVDFRSKLKSELTFDLSSLIKSQSFIDDLAMMCLEKIDYFDEFIVPDIVKEATDELIESNDTIKLFLDDIWSKINKFQKIPTKLLYVAYQKWCKINNPKGGMMKLVTFTKELNQKSEDYRFIKANKDKKSRFKNNDYIDMLKIALDLTYEDIDLSRQSYIESLDYATTEEIDHFLHLIHPLDHELNDKEYQLSMITCVKYNRKELISLYNIE